MIKTIGGVPDGMQALVLKEFANPFILYVTASEADANTRVEQLSYLYPEATILHFPGWDCLPYDRLSPGLDIMASRMAVLECLAEKPQAILVTSAAALIQYLPPRDSFVNKSFTVQLNDCCPREPLVEKLLAQGYRRVANVQESGEFAVRGSLMDIFPAGQTTPVRLDYFGDQVETLKTFDPETQRSLDTINVFTLRSVREVVLTPETIRLFRQNYRELANGKTDDLYEAISEGRPMLGMEHWLPLFYNHCESLLDYIPETAPLICDVNVEAAIAEAQAQIQDYYLARVQDHFTSFHVLPPERLYWAPTHWQQLTQERELRVFTPFVATDDRGGRLLTDIQPKQSLAENLVKLQTYTQIVVIACVSEGSRDRIAHIFEQHQVLFALADIWPMQAAQIQCLIYPLEKGFTTPTHIVVSETDLFGDRIHRALRKRKASDQFLLEASQLAQGDIIVHREHGIARFEGLETVTVDRVPHDCLLLVYEDNDKLYLPVENIELISRYGGEGTAIALDRLGGASWQLRKAKVKKRLREIADYLIRIAAERLLIEAPPMAELPTAYDAFCAGFPYVETDDQQQAIEETFADLASEKPMDRLICGDVGFGKTEVALRSAFMAVSHGKQVAIIVPTTLLCRQHHATFVARFQKTPYRVVQLSRFVSAKEAAQARQDLETGQAHIVIATHALLSERIHFKDLGLLIIDEEHHFGVKQKEKLKQLKSNVHVLALSATPIPRTLQLALSGVRELSLIRTPPIDRLAVRTFVGPFDPVMLKEVILREQFRGGQTFVVCPRVEDLAKVSEILRSLVPGIRMGIAHGQLAAHQLEDVMTAFYDRQFDLLLATNIIESGIDVPSANTLIVYRSDLFGLAQLYQLRGRVGRSKQQGYAYFTILDEAQSSPTAMKRLEVIQSLDTLGAGFQLANHDLELRGSGNIVGEAQSGHVREVGMELYHHLLEEAIHMARAEKEHGALPDFDWTPQINLGLAVLIPETYIGDLDVRLGLYRRLAVLDDAAQIEAFAAELIDRFGKLPLEVQNLLTTMQIKLFCRQAGIEKIDFGLQAAVVTLRNNTFANPEGLLRYLQSLEGRARVRPDQKIVFSGDWSREPARIKAAQQICNSLVQLSQKTT